MHVRRPQALNMFQHGVWGINHNLCAFNHWISTPWYVPNKIKKIFFSTLGVHIQYFQISTANSNSQCANILSVIIPSDWPYEILLYTLVHLCLLEINTCTRKRGAFNPKHKCWKLIKKNLNKKITISLRQSYCRGYFES